MLKTVDDKIFFQKYPIIAIWMVSFYEKKSAFTTNHLSTRDLTSVNLISFFFLIKITKITIYITRENWLFGLKLYYRDGLTKAHRDLANQINVIVHMRYI